MIACTSYFVPLKYHSTTNRRMLLIVVGLLIINLAAAALPSLREQVEIRESWVEHRVQSEGFLPTLLTENGVKHWVVTQREYHVSISARIP